MVEKRSRYPFHRVWISKKLLSNREHYTKLVLPPVSLGYLLTTSDDTHIKILSEKQVKKDAEKLARYFNKAFVREFSKPDSRVVIVAEPDENSFILEVAIVELVPTDLVRNVAGNIAGALFPGGSLLSVGAGGVIAVEGKLRDAKTRDILAEFQDREMAKLRPVDIQGLTAYGFAREAIDDWAAQSRELLNTPVSQKVADSSGIDVVPW